MDPWPRNFHMPREQPKKINTYIHKGVHKPVWPQAHLLVEKTEQMWLWRGREDPTTESTCFFLVRSRGLLGAPSAPV